MFEEECPMCGAPIELSDMGVCPNCGFDLAEMEEEKKCPWCGRYVEKDIGGDFPDDCPYCGKPLDGQVAEPDPVVQMQISYCPNCGTEIKDSDFKFCPYCGHSLHVKDSIEQTVVPEQNDANLVREGWANVIGIVLLGIFIFALIAFLIAEGYAFGVGFVFFTVVILLVICGFKFYTFAFVLLLLFILMTFKELIK